VESSEIGQRRAGRRRRARLGLAFLLGALGCGAPDRQGEAVPVREPGAAPPPLATETSVVSAAMPPRRPPPPRDPTVEACIEERIHTPDYDALAARDTRRKLRRLQVKAECEQAAGN
jgi:hypothetical protein